MKNLGGINWKVRIKSKKFWATIIPALLLVAQIVGGWFGLEVPAEVIAAEAERVINAVFLVLVILGIVVDPTTKGAKDSAQAQTYEKPKGDE